MLQNRSLVYFAKGQWDDIWRNRQQLMSLFAAQNRVLYVENRAHFPHVVRDLRRGDLHWRDFFVPAVRRASNVDGELYVFRFPLWMPISGRTPLRQITGGLRRWLLRRALRRRGFVQPIVWYSHPSMLDLVDEVPQQSMKIYHAVDEYQAYAGNRTEAQREIVRQQEEALIQQVDAVVVVSENLYRSKQPLHPNTHIVSNGVNFEAYAAALADEALPKPLSPIAPPRIGYIGLIGDKLDLPMLLAAMQRHPQWSLVLLGQVLIEQQQETWRALQALPNVHYLGAVPAAEVPHYVKGFQVGLMPYRQNRHAQNISPLKLYDYLAAGIPVASLDIPAVHKFPGFVHIAAEPDDFSEAIARALDDWSPGRAEARRAAAAQHTWAQRTKQISQIIEAHLSTLAASAPAAASPALSTSALSASALSTSEEQPR